MIFLIIKNYSTNYFLFFLTFTIYYFNDVLIYTKFKLIRKDVCMLTTHNFRTLNPSVSQTPLCQTLKSNLPKVFISSATISLRRYVWVDGQSAHISPFELMQAQKANEYYLTNGHLPEEFESKTQLIDPILNRISLHIGKVENERKYYSISTAPCMGILHELICREKENPNVLLSKQQVEANPERFFKHGQIVMEHQGFLKSFLLPRILPLQEMATTRTDKKYAILEFEIFQLNVATGLIGIGLPALTMIGIWVSNYLEKEVTLESELRFSIGFKSIDNRFKSDRYMGTLSNENIYRKAHIKAYIVISAETEQETERVFQKLNSDFKISGNTLHAKKTYFSNEIPLAYWLNGLEQEVEEFIANNPDKDALDAAFYFDEQNLLTVPVATGFALMNDPVDQPQAEHIKHPHAWAETVFKSLQLSYHPFKEEFLFKRIFDKDLGLFHWEQNR